MGKVEAADARGRQHGATLGKRHAGGVFGIEQREERLLLGVIWTGRIAGGGTDAAVALLDEGLGGEVFLAAVAPVAPRLLVEPFGKGLGQPIGECLGHDRRVVVVLAVMAAAEFLAAVARRAGEGPEVVLAAALHRCHEVGEGVERLLSLPLPLLSERMHAAELPRA